MTPEPQTYGFMAELLGLPGAMAALQGRGMRLAALTAAATLVALIVLGTAARRWRPQSGDAGEGSGSEGGGSSAPLDRWQGLAAVALFALAAAARLLHIGAEAISSQEISYIFNAVPPRAPSLLEALLDVSDPNPHTPGFRWAMAWWGRVSTDLGWLRAGPALASAGLAPALHLWLARSGLARAGLAAGVLAALSPLLVFLGRTTMPFGPVVTALALVAWFQDELLRPGGGRWTWPMAVVTAACAWLSYAGGTLLAALLVVGLVQARSPALRRRLGRAWVLAILLGLPLLWQFVSFVALRSELVLSAFADVMARRPPLEALGLFLGVGLERTAGGLGQPGLRAGVLGLAALGGAALGGAVLRRSPLPDSRAAPSLPPSVLALAVGFLGFSVVETVGFALSNGFSYVAIRRFALAATFLLPLAGVGLAWAAERVLGAGWRATGLAVALAALVGGGLPAVLQGQLRPEVRPSIPALLDDLRDGDAVLFGPASFFDSVFWWHYEELGLAPPDHVDGPHFADLETLQGPRAVFLGRNGEWVDAPLGAVPLDVQRVHVWQLLEEPLGLRELELGNVQRWTDDLEALGFERTSHRAWRGVELDRWERRSIGGFAEAPASPVQFEITAGQDDFRWVRGTCPDAWLPAARRTLPRDARLLLPPWPGRWTLRLLDGHRAPRLGLPATPPGVLASLRGADGALQIVAGPSVVGLPAVALRFGGSEPWSFASYLESGCETSAVAWSRIEVRFAPL